VYADPANDITNDVIHNLNQFYKKAMATSTTRTPSAPAGAGIAGGAAQPGESN
jgi:hypothetical protein